ncbi:hypothetical protein HWV62_8349 [Athelia sp. TMB]|nr:hypothetical protein HWV62_8349 [Athelia sp. TMB]
MPMPTKRQPTAPRWDGQPSELEQFLVDVQELADANGLSEADTIRAVLRYAPSEDSCIWRYTEGSLASSWSAFVTEVLALYPGATEHERYTYRSLEELIAAQAEVPIKAPDDLWPFYRRFLAHSGFLLTAGHIGSGECNRLFLKAIHPEFRTRLMRLYHIRHPAHFPDDDYPVSEVLAVAERILAQPELYGPESELVPKPSQPDPEVLAILQVMQQQLSALTPPSSDSLTTSNPFRTASAASTCTGASVSAPHSLASTRQSLGDTSSWPHALSISERAATSGALYGEASTFCTTATTSACTAASASAPNSVASPKQPLSGAAALSSDLRISSRTATSGASDRAAFTSATSVSARGGMVGAPHSGGSMGMSFRCTFCGRPGEYIRRCPLAREYVRTGRVVQDPGTGWLSLPGGGRLPYVVNGTLKDRFDAFHAACSAFPARHSTPSAPVHHSTIASDVPLRSRPSAFVPAVCALDAELLGVLCACQDVVAVEGEDPVLKVLEAAVAVRREQFQRSSYRFTLR